MKLYRRILFFLLALFCIKAEAERAFNFATNRKICEKSYFTFKTLNIVPPSNLHIFGWYDLSDNLLSDQNRVYIVDATVTCVLKSQGGDGKNYFDTLIITPVPNPQIELNYTDTTVCSGETILAEVKSKYSVDNLLWYNNTTHQSYQEGDLIPITEYSYFSVSGTNNYCSNIAVETLNVHVIPKVDPSDLDVNRYDSVNVCPGCSVNLNDVIAHNGDSIRIQSISWSAGGVPVPDPNVSPVVATRYTGVLTAIIYESNECGVVSKPLNNINIVVDAKISDCELFADWQVIGYYPCVEYTFNIINPQPNGFIFDETAINVRSTGGYPIDFTGSSTYTGKTYYGYTITPKDNDTIIISVSYRNTCSGSQILQFTDTLYFSEPKDLQMEYEALYCKGDTLDFTVFEFIEALEIDSVDLGVWAPYFRKVGHYVSGDRSEIQFKTIDTVHDITFYDSLKVTVYYTWCEVSKKSIQKIVPEMRQDCYPVVNISLECLGDSIVMEVTESRLPRSFIKSMQINYPSTVQVCYADTQYYGGHNKYYYNTLLAYNNDFITYKILYNDGGQDTLIIDSVKIDSYVDCSPQLYAFAVSCQGVANPVSIELNNKTGRIVSTNWFTSTDKVSVDSVSANIPADMSDQKATYNYEAHMKKTHFLQCGVLYTMGNRLKLDTIRSLISVKEDCKPSVTKNSNTYCDDERALLTVKNNNYPTDSIISVEWDPVPGCDVFLDSISLDGVFWYFSRNLRKDTTFWATVKVLDYFGDTVAYRLSTEISVKPFPQIFVDSVINVCQDDIINLYDYMSNMVTQVFPPFFPNAPGGDASVPVGQEYIYYGVSAEATYTCASMKGNPRIEDSVKLVRNHKPQIAVDKISDVCTYDSIHLKATFALYDYITWVRDSDTIYRDKRNGDTLYDWVLKSATYKAITKNACGQAVDSFNLVVKPAPFMETAQDTNICLYDTAMLYVKNTSQIDFQTLVWYIDDRRVADQEVKIAINDLDSIYAIAVAYGLNQCRGRDTMLVVPRDFPTVDIFSMQSDTDSTFCSKQDQAFILTASGSATSWTWLSPLAFAGVEVSQITVDPTDTTTLFTVEGTDIYGCKNQANFYLSVMGNQELPDAEEGAVCERSSFTIRADSMPNTTYIWTKPDYVKVYSSVLLIDSMTYADAGNYSLERIQYGCSDIKYFTLTFKPAPIAAILSDNSPLCENSDLEILAEKLSGTDQRWIKPDGSEVLGEVLEINQIKLSDSGIYTFKIKINDCEDSLDVNVRVDSRSYPEVSFDKSFYCDQDSIVLTFLPQDIDSFAIHMDNQVFYTTQNTYKIDALSRADSGMLTVYAHRLTCQDTVSKNLDVRFRPDPVLVYNSQYCVSDDININVQNEAGVSYQWTGPNSFSSSSASIQFLNVTENISGNYMLKATYNQCENFPDTAKLVIYPIPIVVLDTISHLCTGDELLIDMFRPNAFYLWNTGETTSSITINTGGNYSVTITENGCSESDDVYIEERVKPVFYLGNDTTLCYGESYILRVNYPNADYYLWLNDSSTFDYLEIDSAAVYIAMLGYNACEWMDSIIISNKFCGEITMPTAFRPASTIGNDKFKPASKSSPDLILYEIYIYDQWGNQVFYSKDMDEGWDGTFNGKSMPGGVYVYKIIAHETMFGTDLSKTGSFVLVR